jgi:hypothetical protein
MRNVQTAEIVKRNRKETDRQTEKQKGTKKSEKCANCSPVKIANEKTERQTDRKTKLQQNEKFESAAVGSLHL